MSLSTLTLSTLPSILLKQQTMSWQCFNEQHPQACKSLNPEQLECFKLAITLSDFILVSAQQAPELVVSVFTDKLFDFEISRIIQFKFSIKNRTCN